MKFFKVRRVVKQYQRVYVMAENAQQAEEISEGIRSKDWEEDDEFWNEEGRTWTEVKRLRTLDRDETFFMEKPGARKTMCLGFREEYTNAKRDEED